MFYFFPLRYINRNILKLLISSKKDSLFQVQEIYQYVALVHSIFTTLLRRF